MHACGFDFGTSNSTLAVPDGGGVRLLPLEQQHPTIPTALFFDLDGPNPAQPGIAFGRAAMAAYLDGRDGRLMRSIKSALATSLIHETTSLRRRRISFVEVIEAFVREMKRRAEQALGRPIDAVVHGRPVRFVEDDAAADREAEAILADIARRAGYREVSFQFEPVAAAFDYEQQANRDELALIADIGGGTSDFSLIRLGPSARRRVDRSGDILANYGLRLGGTDIDRLFSLKAVMPELGYGASLQRGLLAPNAPYGMLATWAKINLLYTPQMLTEAQQWQREAERPDLFARLVAVLEHHLGHHIAMQVEEAKITLSDRMVAAIDLAAVEAGLSIPVGRPLLVAAIAKDVARLKLAMRETLKRAGVTADAVDTLFLTGGTTLLPVVRQAIAEEVPEARIVEGDAFAAVGQGLAVEASRRYG